VSFEWLSPTIAILRHHPSADGFGGEYDLVCIAELAGSRAFVRALLSRSRFTPRVRRAIGDALRGEGVMVATFERYRGRHRVLMTR
jgi:hypothetical protein